MSKLNNCFILNPEFVKYGISDDLTPGCGDSNGVCCGEGVGNGFGDTNGKVIAHNITHINLLDGGIGCGSGEVNGEGSRSGDNSSGCGDINGSEYWA